jgi:hypothetical protein
MSLETTIAANWIIGGLLTINLTKPFWERFVRSSDKECDRLDNIEKEITLIKLEISKKVSRNDFQKLMMKLSEIEGYMKAKKEG